MRRILPVLIVILIALGACGDDSSSTPDPPEQGSERTTNYWDQYVNWSFTVVETPSGPVECVAAWHAKGGGPSCNWEKYNNQNEEP